MYSFSQMANQIIGTWAFSGNNVYLYDFADSGKVSITNCENDGIPKLITDGWRITDDSLFYLKDKKKKNYVENSFKLLELSDSKMTLNYSLTDYKLVFYKVEPNKQLKINLAEKFFINKSFKLEPSLDTIVTKISFKENGLCTLHRKATTGENVEYESQWKIIKREDNLFLIIDDFEIFAVKKVNEKKSELELVPYGFFRAMSGIDFVKMCKTDC